MKNFIDFEINPFQIEKLTIDAVCKKAKSKKKEFYNIGKGVKQIDFLIDGIKRGYTYRFISGCGGFSSICFIDYVSKNYGKIKNLYASTLRVGKKQIDALSKMDIDYAFFIFGSVFKNGNNAYGYFDFFDEICSKKKWEYKRAKNHSKIILMETNHDFFVIETSSNLNENPEIEQFVVSNDYELYEWYRSFFEAMKK